MIGHLHAFWNDLWPNTVAPSLWTLAGLGLSHWRTRVHLRKQHDALKRHLTDTITEKQGTA
jgi:hypothetical protein